jgi:hypothetical protein
LNAAFVPFAVETARYLARGEQADGQQSGFAPRESNPAATTADEFTNAIDRTNRSNLVDAGQAAREVEDQQRWWQVGLLIMLAALAGEALVGRRAM